MTALLPGLDVEPLVDDGPPPASEELVSCVACDRGAIHAYPNEPVPAFQWDACPTCDGTGFVPLADWLAGRFSRRTAA